MKENEIITSLWSFCYDCHFSCCLHGGTPIVSSSEKWKICCEHQHDDYFLPIKENGVDYFIIGYGLDLNERSLISDPCPYINPVNGRCKIHRYKPLDCRLYPIKLIIDPDSGKTRWVVDEQCPAIKRLSGEFVKKVLTLGKIFLDTFGKAELLHYVENCNPWPLERGIDLDLLYDRKTGKRLKGVV